MTRINYGCYLQDQKNQREIVKLEGGGDFRWVEITKSASSC